MGPLLSLLSFHLRLLCKDPVDLYRYIYPIIFNMNLACDNFLPWTNTILVFLTKFVTNSKIQKTPQTIECIFWKQIFLSSKKPLSLRDRTILRKLYRLTPTNCKVGHTNKFQHHRLHLVAWIDFCLFEINNIIKIENAVRTLQSCVSVLLQLGLTRATRAILKIYRNH